MALDRANYRKIPATPRDEWYVGLDIGQANDPSAIAALQCIVTPGEWIVDDKTRTWKQQKTVRYNVRHLERIPLRTAYPAQYAHVATLLKREPLTRAQFGLDYTGVGRPVADSIAQYGLCPTKILQTSGNEVNCVDAQTFNVPKLFLCSLLETALNYGELKIAPDLPEASQLVDEMQTFTRKVSETGFVSYNAKVGKHDDYVTAVYLCLFMATQRSEVSQQPLGF
jgi:hypothetical protein